MGREGALRPSLSIVVPARDGLREAAPVLKALSTVVDGVDVEVVVVGGIGAAQAPADWIRVVDVSEADILALRRRGLQEARGDIVAIGEDHAVPRPGWCEAVIRAHAEHPEAAAIVGCLENATNATVAGRANFLAFAASWQPPMKSLPAGRPPPSSTLSLKRAVLESVGSEPVGWFEAELIPSLFATGGMVADDRIVVDHFQDHGSLWSIRNAFDSARSSYGHGRSGLAPARRLKVAVWAARNIPGRLWGEAREGGVRITAIEAALLCLIAAAAGVGGAIGTLFGPGRSPDRVA